MNNQIDVNGVKITLNKEQLEEIELKKNGLVIKKEYYPDGNISVKKICIENSKDNIYHNPNGPAVIFYYDDGIIKSKHYFIHGDLHRKDGPAITFYYDNGSIKYEEYYLNHNFIEKMNQRLFITMKMVV